MCVLFFQPHRTGLFWLRRHDVFGTGLCPSSIWVNNFQEISQLMCINFTAGESVQELVAILLGGVLLGGTSTDFDVATKR